MRQKIPVSDGFLIITRTTSLIFRRGMKWLDASNLGEVFGTIMAGPGEIHRGSAFYSTSVTVISQVKYWVKIWGSPATNVSFHLYDYRSRQKEKFCANIGNNPRKTFSAKINCQQGHPWIFENMCAMDLCCCCRGLGNFCLQQGSHSFVISQKRALLHMQTDCKSSLAESVWKFYVPTSKKKLCVC